MSHTQGPWHATGDGYERKRADGSPWRSLCVWAGDRITGKGLEQVAEACVRQGCSPLDETAVANARLIAAAPMLLDALRDLQSAIHEHNKDATAVTLVGVRLAMDKAKAAIWTAEGK